jgi:hypothetical protein
MPTAKKNIYIYEQRGLNHVAKLSLTLSSGTTNHANSKKQNMDTEVNISREIGFVV